MLKEFERRFCELTGEDRGAVRYAARMMQLEGALPTGKRGGRNAPHLTIEHAAAFALGYYGAAMPKNAGKAAAALSSLRAAVKGPTLLDDFLDEVFRVAAKALDSFRHHEDVLDADTLAIFALLRLLKSVLEASSALIDWRLS